MPRYEFRHADGRTCCSGEYYEALCPRCKPLADPSRSLSRAARMRTAAAEPPPAAPSLLDAIRATAGNTNPPAPLFVPLSAASPRTATAAPDCFPVAVSLVDNIRAAAAAARS